jgi:hypothetical protein
MLRKLESLQRETPLTYSQIFIHTALGEIDEAFKALNKASETHVWPFTIKTHPLFAELRKDPRFADFCRKMGIPNEGRNLRELFRRWPFAVRRFQN